MSTNFAGLNSYPRFSTPPRSVCGFPAFPTAPRQSRNFSLPRIEVLVEPSDDSDDEEGTKLLSYHSMRLKRARAPSPEIVDDLEKRKLVSHEATVVKKKPTGIDTTIKWDYYAAPLSPLSDLTESDSSDSEDDVQSKPKESLAESDSDETEISPRSKPIKVVPHCIPDARAPSPGVKRKRSDDSEISSPAPDIVSVKDSEGPSKRRRCTAGTSKPEQAVSSKTARPDTLAMTSEEVQKSIRRYGKTFGTVRKPRMSRGAGLRQRDMTRS